MSYIGTPTGLVPNDESVTTSKIANGAVTDAKIASIAASKLTGALPAIDGSALTGVSSGSNILEQLFLNGNGDSVTVSSGTYSLSNITTFQAVNATYTDVTGSDIAYTPPSGATQVVYEFNYAMYGVTASIITHVKMFLDGNEITQARKTLNGGGSYDGQHVNHRWAIAIGGTADTASGRVSTWTSPKTIKLQVRYYNSSYAGDLHKMVYWDGAALTQVVKPTMQITAYG